MRQERIDAGKRFVANTAIEDFKEFYAAEGYHQNYIKKMSRTFAR